MFTKLLNLLAIIVIGALALSYLDSDETRYASEGGSILSRLFPLSNGSDLTDRENIAHSGNGPETRNRPAEVSDSDQREDAECDQDTATQTWEEARELRLVSGGSMQDGVPTIHIERGVWRELEEAAIFGMAGVFECVVAGPGRYMQRIDFATPGGHLLATIDGIRMRIEYHD